MNLFLLRHFESEKNIFNRYSSIDDNEKLTPKGKYLCKKFAIDFKSFSEKNDIVFQKIHCANSTRAIETSRIIADYMNISVESHMSFRSTNSGNLRGKSLVEAKQRDPFFAHCYYLYRKGLFNSYFYFNDSKSLDKECKKEYESMVIKEFTKILNSEKNVLIVGHRASITAILLYVARKLEIYPSDFYGFIELALGKISWLTHNGNTWHINYVNEYLLDMRDG